MNDNVWEKVFSGRDLSYSEACNTQGKLFEMVKIGFLEEIFPKKGKMLEVGCGTAFVSLYFAKRGFSVYCLDSNQKILGVAQNNFKKEGKKGIFVLGNAEKLPFKTGEFDVVTSFGLLEHFVDPGKAISEMARVCKKGGIVFADIVPDRFSVQTLGNIFNFIVTLVYWLLCGKLGLGWEKAKRNFHPLYFENKISWTEYKRLFFGEELGSIEVRGNRPFPRLTLPQALDRLYARVLKLFLPAWRDFDHTESELALFWGAGYWIWGKKMV